MKTILIAPCGMNCHLCIAYLREKKTCPGCRDYNNNKSDSRTLCVIKNCAVLKEKNLKFCSDKCHKFPCLRLKNLDKRYRTKYGMSMIENLEFIHQNGIRKFIKHEKQRWIQGKKVFCVHHKKYFDLKTR